MKSLEHYFRDWEADVFGYGYGTGEQAVIPALAAFLRLCNDGPIGGGYSYQTLESALTPAVAWLLINTLCHAEVLEYGTSPRYGWLTPQGRRLQEFVVTHSDEELIAFTDREESDDICSQDACNCGPNGYAEGRVCPNPFWSREAAIWEELPTRRQRRESERAGTSVQRETPKGH